MQLLGLRYWFCLIVIVSSFDGLVVLLVGVRLVGGLLLCLRFVCLRLGLWV